MKRLLVFVAMGAFANAQPLALMPVPAQITTGSGVLAD